MDEQEFDSLFQHPFRREDVMQADTLFRRCATLAIALWGRNSGDLRRQLLAPHPEIPPGFDLADLRNLERRAEIISGCLNNPRYLWASSSASPIISIGTQRFTAWEARWEIVRRAIEYLENR